MYTSIPSVLTLISLLKQFNVRHLVLSPGTRNTAFVGSVENDEFFTCYSIVDERSAGYFALGIAEQLNVPVLVSCTAATAASNYAPAVKEAYERGLQLIALTADQDAYTMFHMLDQCINQVDMYHDFIRLSVDVPMVSTKNSAWYTNRRINEALLEMNHHGTGPVQINYHMSYGLEELSNYPVKKLPVARKITRYESLEDISSFKKQLEGKKKILVVLGSMSPDERLNKALKEFYNKFSCAVVYDTFSNQADSEFILPKALGDIANELTKKDLKPDLIITCGAVFYSTIKYFLSSYGGIVENWQIAEDGMIIDGYHGLSKVFECKPYEFFENIVYGVNSVNDKVYYSKWKKYADLVTVGNIPFTNLKVIESLLAVLPKGAILHTSVLDAIRMSNYVKMDCGVECYANIGADGIDGALSAFLGQNSVNDKLSFLLIGDLSLMYDMNVLVGLKDKGVRILVINNYAGAEFHKNFGVKRIPTLNKHIAAGHTTKIEQCAVMTGLTYMSANDQTQLDDALKTFVCKGEQSILLEVFTNAEIDADTLKEYWRKNKIALPRTLKQKFKSFVARVLRKLGVMN